MRGESSVSPLETVLYSVVFLVEARDIVVPFLFVLFSLCGGLGAVKKLRRVWYSRAFGYLDEVLRVSFGFWVT